MGKNVYLLLVVILGEYKSAVNYYFADNVLDDKSFAWLHLQLILLPPFNCQLGMEVKARNNSDILAWQNRNMNLIRVRSSSKVQLFLSYMKKIKKKRKGSELLGKFPSSCWDFWSFRISYTLKDLFFFLFLIPFRFNNHTITAAIVQLMRYVKIKGVFRSLPNICDEVF